MLISWTVIGYWHGGAPHYIFGVGIWFWLVIVLGEICSPVFVQFADDMGINRSCFSWKLFQMIRTFLVVTFGFSFFRAPTIRAGLEMWSHFCSNGLHIGYLSDYSLGLDDKDLFVLLISLLVLLLVSLLQEKHGSVRKLIAEQNIVFRWGVYLLLLFATIILGNYGEGFDAANFIYQGF